MIQNQELVGSSNPFMLSVWHSGFDPRRLLDVFLLFICTGCKQQGWFSLIRLGTCSGFQTAWVHQWAHVFRLPSPLVVPVSHLPRRTKSSEVVGGSLQQKGTKPRLPAEVSELWQWTKSMSRHPSPGVLSRYPCTEQETLWFPPWKLVAKPAIRFLRASWPFGV